jgi:hypothetical protein
VPPLLAATARLNDPLAAMSPRLLLSALLLCALLACVEVGGESGRKEARPNIAPPRLAAVEILPPKIDRQPTGRVELRDPLALAATQVDLYDQGDGVVDILWVIDDTGSMKNQRATLGANFEKFTEALLALGSDFQMGVISTNSTDDAVLRGTTKIIHNQTPDLKAKFIENTTFPDSRARWAQGLRMMQLALSPPRSTGPNAGFLRPGAALAVIAVADDDDGSYGDTGHYVRFLKGAKGKGNENLVSFSVIGGTTPDGCFPPGEEIYWGGRAEPAFRYSAVATKTGGVVGSICDQSFENTLLEIAKAINTLRRVFPLSLVPDVSTLSVRVNEVIIPRDVVNGWQYRADTRSIAFLGNYVPPPRAKIRIEYAIAE